MKIRQVILITSLLILTACGQEYFFFDTHEIEHAEWHMDNVEHFQFETQDTSTVLDFRLNLRNNTSYPYRNIYAFIEMRFPNGRTRIDTVLFPNMASPEGRWLGKGVGGSYDNSIIYNRKSKLPLPGAYQVTVKHAMRDTVLVGIEQVGIQIETSSAR